MIDADLISQKETVDESAGVSPKSRVTQKVRVQLDLTQRAMGLLNELRRKTDATSNAEVIRDALKLYDGLITEAERGAEFLIRDKDGKLSAFRIFL